MNRSAFASLALSLLALTACGGSADALDTGTLELEFGFGERDCAAAGVAAIEIDVAPVAGGEGQWHEVSCEQALYGLPLSGLAPGQYVVSLEGLGPDGDVRYEAADLPLYVRAGDNGTDRLTALGQGVNLQWTVQGGGCGDVEGVMVQAMDPDGRVWEEAVYPCADRFLPYEGLYPGTWTFSIAIQDYDGPAVGTRPMQTFEVELVRGFPAGLSVDL